MRLDAGASLGSGQETFLNPTERKKKAEVQAAERLKNNLIHWCSEAARILEGNVKPHERLEEKNFQAEVLQPLLMLGKFIRLDPSVQDKSFETSISVSKENPVKKMGIEFLRDRDRDELFSKGDIEEIQAAFKYLEKRHHSEK